jgi:DNA-binding NarL/FixJ family response regulator
VHPGTATPREQEIMSLVARGLSNREIAELLEISHTTVRTHRQNFMEKFSLRNAAEITAYAVQQGYYNPN